MLWVILLQISALYDQQMNRSGEWPYSNAAGYQRRTGRVFLSLDSGRNLHQYHSQSQNQFDWNGNGFVCTECSRSSSGKPQHCSLQFHVKWNYITYLCSFEGKKFQSENLLFYVSYCSVATQTMMTSGFSLFDRIRSVFTDTQISLPKDGQFAGNIWLQYCQALTKVC